MGLIRESETITLLREEKYDEFNARAEHTRVDLENADLRMVDLRRANLAKANLRGAYLRNADMRGVDLSDADLTGASLHDARISGCLFPMSLPPEEIALSIVHGTRMRPRL
ncbi:MAG TPA: pentapeptide repeat-containing protein [Terriglobales bacterium]|nr:pentapeptide repeat-containing protein [Terriglobales bacterium]